MQEIGVWTTANGTSEARLEFESEDGDVAVTELPGWVSDAVKGALAGAATGAAAGPGGALVGAVTGGALGAASGAGKPAPSPSSPPAGAPSDASRTNIVQALQQFAAVMPALVQLLAAGSQARKESFPGDAGERFESADGSDWGPESFQGTWTQP
jgi:phage tail tape-measure protein